MSVVYTRYSILFLLLSLLEEYYVISEVKWIPHPLIRMRNLTPKSTGWDADMLYDLKRGLFQDMKRKTQSVIYMKSKYKRHMSYFIGQAGFVLRRLFSQLVHINIKWKRDMKKNITAQEMVANLTTCQKVTTHIIIAVQFLTDYEKLIEYTKKKTNGSVAGLLISHGTTESNEQPEYGVSDNLRRFYPENDQVSGEIDQDFWLRKLEDRNGRTVGTYVRKERLNPTMDPRELDKPTMEP